MRLPGTREWFRRTPAQLDRTARATCACAANDLGSELAAAELSKEHSDGRVPDLFERFVERVLARPRLL